MRILVVVTFGGLSFWLTPLPVLLIRSIQQRHAGLELDSKGPYPPSPFFFPWPPCVGHTSERTYGGPLLTCVSPPPAHAPYQQPGASPEHTIGWSNNQNEILSTVMATPSDETILRVAMTVDEKVGKAGNSLAKKGAISPMGFKTSGDLPKALYPMLPPQEVSNAFRFPFGKPAPPAFVANTYEQVGDPN